MTQSFALKFFLLLTTTALILTTAACSSGPPYHASSAAPDTSGRYVESVLADQSDLSVFYQALLSTGVAAELNDNTEYTIFAPTNAAFARIRPKVFPCFYAVQCRQQVAAVLRNHIVPRNESINRFSRWGGPIGTIGGRGIMVEEPYKGRYTVEGNHVLYHNDAAEAGRVQGDKIGLYRIDGLIVSDQELAAFRAVPFASAPATVIEKTVTTYRTPVGTSYARQPMTSSQYYVPGGVSTPPVIYWDDADDLVDSVTETTTVTRKTSTE